MGANCLSRTLLSLRDLPDMTLTASNNLTKPRRLRQYGHACTSIGKSSIFPHLLHSKFDLGGILLHPVAADLAPRCEKKPVIIRSMTVFAPVRPSPCTLRNSGRTCDAHDSTASAAAMRRCSSIVRP